MTKPPARGFAYVIFSHKDHRPPKAECKSCHHEIWEEGPYRSVVRSTELYPVVMDACYTCHQQKQATVACLDCHREHHSFPDPPRVEAANRFDWFLFGMLGLVLGAFGYTYADVRLARRWLEPPPAPLPASVKGGGPAAEPGKAPASAGEIMPFPKVDVEACISCSSCYNSCPKQVLAGDDHGKSTVVNPNSCIALEGCSVCEQGCPTGAIRVSTAPLKRTVERPEIDEHNEAKLPGLFFAGEVIGAALIKSAINQGNECIKYIAEKKPRVADVPYDVIIVGAGPAGLGAGLEAKRRQLRYLILERDTVASTIRNYPRDKAVLAEPVKMPLYGQLPMMDAEKDTLMEVWTAIVRTTGLQVVEFEEALDVKRREGALEVKTLKGAYLAANVILAIGTRGNPRRLGVAGEGPSRVSYNLIDPADWKGKSVVVVGGGDSAIEAAVALGKQEGTKVLLSYRKGEFSRVKKRNAVEIEESAKAGRVELVFNSSIQELRPASVVVKTQSGEREVPADHIFALIGADPPRAWIEKLGVAFITREEEVVTW
jgi:putative YpdA family bacillithiol system oxidoreductase